jgi:hypothetical protein
MSRYLSVVVLMRNTESEFEVVISLCHRLLGCFPFHISKCLRYGLRRPTY